MLECCICVRECLGVGFACVSVFVREFVYLCACVCVSVCDVRMYVCFRMYVHA